MSLTNDELDLLRRTIMHREPGLLHLVDRVAAGGVLTAHEASLLRNEILAEILEVDLDADERLTPAGVALDTLIDRVGGLVEH